MREMTLPMVAYAGGLGWWSCFQVTILVDLLGSWGLGPLVAGYVGALIWLTLSDPRLVGWPSSLCDIGPKKVTKTKDTFT